jgi:hypothetical protein
MNKPCPFHDEASEVSETMAFPYSIGCVGVKCEYCGANACKDEWNTRVMPECVRRLCNGIRDAEAQAAVASVREYFGEPASNILKKMLDSGDPTTFTHDEIVELVNAIVGLKREITNLRAWRHGKEVGAISFTDFCESMYNQDKG